MKLKRIVSSLLAVVMAFGVVSLATVDENGKIFGNTLTAEAVTEKTATKMPDNAITFSNTYSDELEIIPVASKNGMYYYNNKVIYFYSVANNTFRKIYDYNDKGRHKDTVICVYADSEKGKFYIVWLDSSNQNKKYYYLDEFDVKSEKFVSTKDISSLVGSNTLSYPKSIGVDSQNRYYLAVYDENQNKYVINLISADMKLLSSAVAGDAVYKFSGFDKTNGNFYFEGYTDWIYWGYSHDTQSLKCGNVKNNKISVSDYYVDILRNVKDYRPAIDFLRLCRPKMPSNLKVNLSSSEPLICKLSWNASIEKGISYCIVRKENGIPQKKTDGLVLATNLVINEFTDRSIQSGIMYGYAVFCCRYYVYSTPATCQIG